MKRKGLKNKAGFLAAPLTVFTLVFVLVPLVYIIVLSFLQRDVLWGVTNQFTLENYAKMLDASYLKTFLDSFLLALATTVICLLLGYPFGYFMAKLSPGWQRVCLMLTVVPFWTSALIRIYGWMILLRSNGVLNTILLDLGLIDQPLKILYSYPAVLIGMVYSLLPFLILPVYTSVQKLDWATVEAARDLGAGGFTAFCTVTLRQTLPGVLSGVVLVFVPSVGLFFLSDLLGGGKIMLVGNLIKNQLLTARNWPFGAALSVVMMALTIVLIALYRKAAGAKSLEGFV